MSKALRLSELRTRLDKLEKGGAGNPYAAASDDELRDLAEAMLADPDTAKDPDAQQVLLIARTILDAWQRGADGAWGRVPDPAVN